MSVAKRLVMGVVATLAAAVVGCCALLGLTGCSTYPSVDEAKSQDRVTATISTPSIMTDGVLTVGVNADDAPYCWVTDPSTGALSGLDVDVASQIASLLGLEVRFVNVGDNADAAASGLCDVVMGVTADQVGSASVFVGSYAQSAAAVFSKSSSGDVTLDQLLASTVGVQENSSSALTLEGISSSVKLKGYSSLNDALDALETGEVPYVVCDSFMGGYLAVTYDDIEFAGALEMPRNRGIAVSGADVELSGAVQSALDTLATNGIESAILRDYVGDLPSITQANVIVSTSSSTASSSGAGDQAATEAATEAVTDEQQDAAAEATGDAGEALAA